MTPIITPITRKVDCISQNGKTYCEKTILTKEQSQDMAQDIIIFIIVAMAMAAFIAPKIAYGSTDFSDYIMGFFVSLLMCFVGVGLYCLILTATGA